MPLNRLLALTALTGATMFADVTLRYKTEVKMNPALPAQMTEQASKAMGAALPTDTGYQWKDGKGLASFGKLRSIVDVPKGQITLIDPEQKRIVTSTFAEMMDSMGTAMAQIPPEAKAAMAAMKVSSESKATGRTEAIRGMQAEERELTMSIEGPGIPNMPPGPMMKMSLQFWTAAPTEVLRVPALRELAGYNMWSIATMNPAGSMEKMFQAMPGMADGMGKFIKDMQGLNAVVLRSRVLLWMPSMAAAMKQMTGKEFDASVPFMEMNQEVSELSDAPIAASVFAAPEGYKTVPLAELVKEMMPKPQGAGK
jgi:hypothetical protein